MFVIFIQLVSGTTFSCESNKNVQTDSFSSSGIFNNSQEQSSISIEEEKNCADSNRTESHQEHCTKCTPCNHIIVLLSNFEFDFTALSLLTLDFNYSFIYNHQFISFESKPPCYS